MWPFTYVNIGGLINAPVGGCHMHLQAPCTAINLNKKSNNDCKLIKKESFFFKLFNFTFVLILRWGMLCLVWSIPSSVTDKYFFGLLLALGLCL